MIFYGLLQDLSKLVNTEGCDESIINPYSVDSEVMPTDEPQIKQPQKRSPRKMEPPTPSRPAKLSKKAPTRFEKTVSQLKAIAEMSCIDHEDQHEKFGKFIAAQLREMPPRSVIILQEQIQSLITREKLRLIDGTLSSSTSDASFSRPESACGSNSYYSSVQEEIVLEIGEPQSAAELFTGFINKI